MMPTGGSPAADSTKLASYTDGGTVRSYVRGAVAWAVGNGFLTGYGDGAIRSAGMATRAEVGILIVRFMGA